MVRNINFYSVVMHCPQAAQLLHDRRLGRVIIFYCAAAHPQNSCFLTIFLFYIFSILFSITTRYSKRRASLVSQPYYFFRLLHNKLSSITVLILSLQRLIVPSQKTVLPTTTTMRAMGKGTITRVMTTRYVGVCWILEMCRFAARRISFYRS